jgi:hypothetical protein
MRALRVIGLAEDGSVICETEAASEGEKPERFTLRADDKLRAAARGDLPRLGQIEIELESQMRPREIQARIRAGASVDEVAAVAGMSPEKVDRFAYPVMLERFRTAELAQRAHPVRDDGPDVRTLGEVVANTFGQRGQDYTAVTWDSWRGEDGKWVVQLRWNAGRSDNRAHWTFHPGAHGGTVTVLDELAADLIDPTAGKPLRTVRPVTALAEQALMVDDTSRAEPPYEQRRAEAAGQGHPVAHPAAHAGTTHAPHQLPNRPSQGFGSTQGGEPGYRMEPARPEPVRRPEPAQFEQPRFEEPRHEEPRVEEARVEEARFDEPRFEEPRFEEEPQPFDDEPAAHESPRSPAHASAVEPEAVTDPEPEPEPEPTPVEAVTPETPAVTEQSQPPAEPEPAVAQEKPAEPEPAPAAAAASEPAPTRRGRNNRPVVPSWEDVLLGVRSNPNRS